MGTEFFQGMLATLQPVNLLAMAVGSIAGLIFGMVPGLTTSTCIIVFLPLTFVMDPVPAIALLLGIYTGGMSGGSFSSILINIPGTPSASATQIDGYPMAKRGEPARALSISITASLYGGLFSYVCLALFAPQLANVALEFKTPELFALILFGISIISSFAVKSVEGVYLCSAGPHHLHHRPGPNPGNRAFHLRNYRAAHGVPHYPRPGRTLCLSRIRQCLERGGDSS
jgi:putative tricarboxylic transport membrane protein